MSTRIDSTPFFTVFTPTYNRAHLLNRAYQSLKEQTDKDFEWLIVDDGSTDKTRELVKKWMNEVNFPIQYYYQPNSGKHVAINRGVAMARGFMFVILDSDDWLAPTALESIKRVWNSIPKKERDQWAGVVGLYAYPSGKVVGTPFPADVLDSNAIEIRTKYRVKGDNFGANRVDVLRMYSFPEEMGKFVPESLVWNRIARRYKLRFVNEVWAFTEYQPDGLSAKSLYIRARSPYAARLYYKEFCELTGIYIPLIERLKGYANFVRYSMHANISIGQQVREVPSNLLWAVSFPIGWLLYVRDRNLLRRE